MTRISLMNRSVRTMTRLYKLNVPIIPKLLNYINRIIFACDIPPSVMIGRGSYFSHSGLGVVIHSKARIGDNCKIFQGVTIGGRGNSGTPIIGNNVFIGANSTVLGGIYIGDNATIGANSLIISDVENNSTVAGNPARKLSKEE